MTKKQDIIYLQGYYDAKYSKLNGVAKLDEMLDKALTFGADSDIYINGYAKWLKS